MTMTFLSLKHLQEGMVLDKDVYLYDSKTSNVAILRAGGILTQDYINKMAQMGILGVYVQTNDDAENHSRYSSLKTEMKQEVISRIRSTYEMFSTKSFRNINVNSINATIDISHQLVDSLMSNSDILINVEDLRLYDDYTYNHSLGVAILSIAIGLSLALNRNDLYDLALCAILHDIGKMGIPIEIISKPSRLTAEEYQIVKQHPVLGTQFLLRNKIISKKICSGILTHHERVDGTGYPNGLAGDGIPLFGRIVSVADVYDALTSSRPYRDPSSAPEAIEYIMGGSGKIFDIQVVSAFLKKVSPYPVGSCVKLSNGKTAVVVKQNDYNPLRPVIQLFEDCKAPLDLYYQRSLQNIVIKEPCSIDTDIILK